MVDVCDCASNWRIELTNLLTGATTHVVTPVSFEFQTAFMEPGRGSITFHRRGTEAVFSSGFIPADRMFPATTGIFFSRIHGGRATPNEPVHMFGGFIETMQANSDGLVTLGFAEMQKYLDYRMVRTDLVFEDESQLSIGANLVLYARGENFAGGSVDDAPALGIPLIGGFGTSAINRDRTYLASERPFIGELLRNLTQVIDGPVYTVDHHRNAGPIAGLTENWYTELGFSDTWLQTFPAPLVAWHHVEDFAVNVDMNEIANQVDAIGEPDADGNPLIYSADSPTPFNPRYDAAPSFSGVTNIPTLNQHAFGYQQDHMFQASNLQLFFAGLDYGQAAGGRTLSIDDLRPGDAINIDLEAPNWIIRGGPDLPQFGTVTPRIGRLSVSAPQEGVERVTAQVIVDEYPTSFLGSTPGDCVDC